MTQPPLNQFVGISDDRMYILDDHPSIMAGIWDCTAGFPRFKICDISNPQSTLYARIFVKWLRSRWHGDRDDRWYQYFVTTDGWLAVDHHYNSFFIKDIENTFGIDSFQASRIIAAAVTTIKA